MRQSDWCEIHILNDLIDASNIPLSIREHRCYLFVFCLFFFGVYLKAGIREFKVRRERDAGLLL